MIYHVQQHKCKDDIKHFKDCFCYLIICPCPNINLTVLVKGVLRNHAHSVLSEVHLW